MKIWILVYFDHSFYEIRGIFPSEEKADAEKRKSEDSPWMDVVGPFVLKG